jgi:hypothetical protein
MHGHYWNGGCWKPLNTVSEEYRAEYVESLRGTPFDDPAGMREIVKTCELPLEIRVSAEMPPNKAILVSGNGSSPVSLEFDTDETGSTAVIPAETTREYAVESVTVNAPKADEESPFAKMLQDAMSRGKTK